MNEAKYLFFCISLTDPVAFLKSEKMNSSNKNLEESVASSFLPQCKIRSRISISKKRQEFIEKSPQQEEVGDT